mmetsp:Transcript_18991/g.30896  ORF Transcript_18991/g.30896 Transcript_18991/m.30896 type:complete len:124 (+) Transcript_18991:888-1259(+)
MALKIDESVFRRINIPRIRKIALGRASINARFLWISPHTIVRAGIKAVSIAVMRHTVLYNGNFQSEFPDNVWIKNVDSSIPAFIAIPIPNPQVPLVHPEKHDITPRAKNVAISATIVGFLRKK